MRVGNVANLAPVEALHAVPAVDSTANVNMRDVVGNKGDTVSVSGSGVVISMVSRLKGFFSVLAKPAMDSANNYWMSEVVGSKLDAGVNTVGTTKSILAYVKGQTQELDQRSVPVTARGSNATAALTDVVNITDKGVLAGVCQYSEGADIGLLVVTIDGVIIRPVGAFVHNSMSNSLGFNHRFNTSLRVEHRNSGGAVTIRTEAAYTTD